MPMVLIFSPLTLWAQTEEPETEVPSSVDAEAITLFGFNFDLTTSELKKVLKDRFDCHSSIMVSYNQCTPPGGSEIINWTLNTLGDVVWIGFKCEIFNGCNYTPTEVFANIRERFKLVGEVQTNPDYICDSGVAGEKICVSKKKRNLITLAKKKFRQKPISFD